MLTPVKQNNLTRNPPLEGEEDAKSQYSSSVAANGNGERERILPALRADYNHLFFNAEVNTGMQTTF